MVEYRDNLAVHVFSDTVPGLASLRGTAEAAGCRIVSERLIGPDADPSEGAMPGAVLLIELEKEGAGQATIALLDWAEREAERGTRRSVVSAPSTLIDLIFARAPHPDVDHLCSAGEEERLAAVARAGRPKPARLHDTGRDDGPRIRGMPSGEAGGHAAGDRGEAGVDAPYIRAMIRARRLRDQYFSGDLFADPAWDILLDLMAARLEGRKVAVSSLCIAAAVPATTALRWIKLLTDRGLLVRVADPEDGRRVHIELAEEAARVLGACLGQARRVFLNMV